MKKILHILVLPKMAGSQNVSFEILKSLPDNDYDKYVLFSDVEDCGDRKECIKRFQEAGAKVLFSKKLKRNIGVHDIPATVEIYKLCKKEKFDIVHTHSTKPGIIGRIAATLAGVPFVIHTVHGLAFHNFIKFPKWQFYWLCEMLASIFCNKIVLVNKYYKRYFNWLGGKVTTIYNGIDFSEYEPYAKETNSITESIKILFVGRLDTPKNPIMLLKAAEVVIKQYSNVEFTIVGDGDLYNDCKIYIKNNGLSNNVKLLGWQNNVSKFYKTHDIFVLPSIYESFGLIFLEAGYYYLPSVTTNVEGIPEVVKDNYSGLLSNPNDVEAFANHIIQLIINPQLRCQMGINAHNRVVELFDIQKMTDAYSKIYQ